MISTDEQMRNAIAAQAAEWFVEHRAGALCEARREAFIDWLRASPAHAREYLSLTGLAHDLGDAVKRFDESADALVARAHGENKVIQPFVVSNSKSLIRTRENGVRTAAAALLAAAVLLASVWWLQGRANYATAHAEQRSWRLDDGSTVHLNSGTEIKVRFEAARRQVDLIKGQAVFRVAKDSSRPFWVNAGDVVVKAVGTEFDVYRQKQGAVISVMEGRVAVWNAPVENTSPAAQLDAGEQARVTSAAAVVSQKPDDVRKTVAWLQRQVVFDHDELADAVAEFNRYNELQIHIADSALRAEEVSGIFSAYDTESFLRFLERQPGMRVTRERNEVTVRATP
jgi:transmembrane sensor